MKTNLIFEIECGEKTCAAEPGKFCYFLNLGFAHRRLSCALFGRVEDKNGWIQRHKGCLLNERHNNE